MAHGPITTDAQQQALAFLVGQLQHLESEVYRKPYAHIRYPELVPVDTSANPYVQGVTYFSADGYGQASFIGRGGEDFPLVSTTRDKHSVLVESLGSSYEYNMFDLESARLLGQDLNADNVNLVRRVMEEKIDSIVLNGEADLSWDPLWSKTGVSKIDLAAGTSTHEEWDQKTGNEIVKDVNRMQNTIYEATKQVIMPDTLILPPSAYAYIVTTPINDTSDTSIYNYLLRATIYTAETGNPILIRGVHGFEDAGASKVGRAMMYARNPSVLKLHLPMPVRFLPLFQKTPTTWQHAAIFRTGGLEIRMPHAMIYADKVTA